MAKTIGLEVLSFQEGGFTYKLLEFNPKKMTVLCKKTALEGRGDAPSFDVSSVELPFAHLPKKIKKIIHPLTH